MLNRKYLSLGVALRAFVLCIVLVGVSAFVTSRVISDDTAGKAGEPQKPQMPPEMAEMMKKMQELGTPGPHHRHLDAFVGEWNAAGKFWMGPGEPTATEGTATIKWILDGRYIQEEYRSEWGGQPFSGLSIFGYDNLAKQYTSLWIDNMSTAFFNSTGECDSSGKSFSFSGESPDCMTGKLKKHRMEWRVISKDKHVFEMHEADKDGKMAKMMEIVYTRK